ncbi:MAG: hypothetical protein IJF34_04385, partial [Clostridia bacterium]|nr:hypothetical protein [Clostridia bacterium]
GPFVPFGDDPVVASERHPYTQNRVIMPYPVPHKGADIVVVESEMEATAHINEVVACPDQTFGLNAVLG